LFAQKPNSRVIFFSQVSTTSSLSLLTIIFHQFNDTLNTVSDILYENGIDNVFVEGNVHNRTRAIKSFREEDDIKVIMLSLRNAASGTNLVEATHIVLMGKRK
jgi:SNF2 family DNA or RNA helicase